MASSTPSSLCISLTSSSYLGASALLLWVRCTSFSRMMTFSSSFLISLVLSITFSSDLWVSSLSSMVLSSSCSCALRSSSWALRSLSCRSRWFCRSASFSRARLSMSDRFSQNLLSQRFISSLRPRLASLKQLTSASRLSTLVWMDLPSLAAAASSLFSLSSSSPSRCSRPFFSSRMAFLISEFLRASLFSLRRAVRRSTSLASLPRSRACPSRSSPPLRRASPTRISSLQARMSLSRSMTSFSRFSRLRMSSLRRMLSSLFSWVLLRLRLPSRISSVLISTNLFSSSPTISSPSVWISMSESRSERNLRSRSRSLLISCAACSSFSSDWYFRYSCSYSLFFSETSSATRSPSSDYSQDSVRDAPYLPMVDLRAPSRFMRSHSLVRASIWRRWSRAASVISSTLASCSTALRLLSCASFRSCSFSPCSLAFSPASDSLSRSQEVSPLFLSSSEMLLMSLLSSSFSCRRGWEGAREAEGSGGPFSMSRKEKGSTLPLGKAYFLQNWSYYWRRASWACKWGRLSCSCGDSGSWAIMDFSMKDSLTGREVIRLFWLLLIFKINKPSASNSSIRVGPEEAVSVRLEVAHLRLREEGLLLARSLPLLSAPLPQHVLQVLVVVRFLALQPLSHPVVVVLLSRVHLDHHQAQLPPLARLHRLQSEAQFEEGGPHGQEGKGHVGLGRYGRNHSGDEFVKPFLDPVLVLGGEGLSDDQLCVDEPGAELGRDVGVPDGSELVDALAPHHDETAVVVECELDLLEQGHRLLETMQVYLCLLPGLQEVRLCEGVQPPLPAVEEDQLVAPLPGLELQREELVVEAVAAQALQLAQLVVPDQLLEFAGQLLLAALQLAEEIEEVEFEEGVEVGEVLGVGYLQGLLEEVGDHPLGLRFLRGICLTHQLPQVADGHSLVPLQQRTHLLPQFLPQAPLQLLQLLEAQQLTLSLELALDAVELFAGIEHHNKINERA